MPIATDHSETLSGASGKGFLDRSGLDVYKTDFLLLLYRNIKVKEECAM